MITPFEVYLVMQLDTISNVSLFALCILGLTFAILSGTAGMMYADGDKEDSAALKRVLRKIFPYLLVSLMVSTFLPSTKTAAAMIVLPALTSDEVVKPLGNEARELYDLAKQALKKAVDGSTTEPKVEKSDD